MTQLSEDSDLIGKGGEGAKGALPSEWRPLFGYEGFYEVSNLGEVRSLHFDPPRMVSTRYSNKDGYRLVTLTRGPYQRKIHELHRLVCETFHGPAPDGCEVDHIDRDRMNAAPSNLRWLAVQANRTRRWREAA